MKNSVNTRKQLEAQGIAGIETNDWWQYDDAKWVLVLNDDYVEQGYVFKETKTTMWADLTISRLVEIYNNGIIKQ